MKGLGIETAVSFNNKYHTDKAPARIHLAGTRLLAMTLRVAEILVQTSRGQCIYPFQTELCLIAEDQYDRVTPKIFLI